jgi:DNA-binding HxlR family transcriptional regulator
MERKSFADMHCPIAQSLELVGEWWSILILRDIFAGKTRFAELQSSLGIAKNVLSTRLARLVEAGLLQRQLYARRPPRYEYQVTPMGRDFYPVLIALMTWGNKWVLEGKPIQPVDALSGRAVDPLLVDAETGQPITAETVLLTKRLYQQRAERSLGFRHSDDTNI